MTSHTPRARSLALALALPALPLAAAAQDPVIKPTTTTTTTLARLPGPGKVVASQLPDGRIRVVWSAVNGAASYSLIRSVPPAAAAPISPNPTDTVYIDSDVRVGSYYYYTVAAVNDAGGVGLKVGAAPVKATVSATGAGGATSTSSVLPPPTGVKAMMAQNGSGAWLNLASGAPGGVRLIVERAVASDPTAAWQLRPSSTLNLTVPGGGFNSWDSFDGVPTGTRLVWRVRYEDLATGNRSAPALTNELTVGATTTTTTTTTAAAPTSTATAVGSVVVSMATPATIRVGATASLATALGGTTALRWLSLDEGIATVDAAGTATGRAAGRAQILAVGRASDGAVRVTAVQVTVAP